VEKQRILEIRDWQDRGWRSIAVWSIMAVDAEKLSEGKNV
jgi:hypothetical protein